MKSIIYCKTICLKKKKKIKKSKKKIRPGAEPRKW